LREHDEHAQGVEATREHTEEPQRRLVGPLHVVDEQDQQPTGREVRAQPVQAVERPEARVDLGCTAGHLWQ
jgi:hypothetical protein